MRARIHESLCWGLGLLLGTLLIHARPIAAEEGSTEGTGTVQRLRVRILNEHPHDEAAFTQGLLWHQEALFESTGKYGESTLRQVDPESGEIDRIHTLPETYFAEGLARVGDRLVQLTWRAGLAFVYDASTFELRQTLRYEGEGWGLCSDGESLFMSDGSAQIVRRDPVTFAVTARLGVTLEGRPLRGLNELECAEGWLYANIWRADTIARIDSENGEVVALVDASPLRKRLGLTADGENVLNGIAYRADSASFLLTGKHWPRLFEVIFVE